MPTASLARTLPATLAATLLATTADSAGERIELISLASGSEGANRVTDTTPLRIDRDGNAIDPQAGKGHEDFLVKGVTGESRAFGAEFSLILAGIADVDTTQGDDLGARLQPGPIDRDSKGLLGIRHGESSGIDQRQGFMIGFDASSLDPSLAIQLTGIKFRYVGGTETGAVVSRADTSQHATFGHEDSGAEFTAVNDAPFVELAPLNLLVQGGTRNAELASAFADDYAGKGAFRIESFQLEIVPAQD